MKILLLILTVTLTLSCSTISKGTEVIQKAHDAVKMLEAKAAEGKAAFDAYMAKTDAQRSEFEKVTGEWDLDGDGRVSISEVVDLVKRTATGAITDSEQRDLISDHWGELLGVIGTTLAAGWIGKKTGKKVIAGMHNAGRAALGENDRVVGG